MSSMIHVLFDLLVNSIEGLLIYLLLSRKLQFKSNALLILSPLSYRSLLLPA